MVWLSQNWVWILFFVAFVAMHLFGHGGHGGHGGGHNTPQPTSKDDEQGTSKSGSGHQH